MSLTPRFLRESVERGNADGEGFTPGELSALLLFHLRTIADLSSDCIRISAALISLTAPKLGVKEYAEQGRLHFLGGRFVPGFVSRPFLL